MFKNLFILFLLFCVLPCWKEFDFKEGDLLFQSLDCGDLCEAITSVTSSYNNLPLTHVGVVLFRENQFFVLEAYGEKVTLTLLDKFLGRKLDKSGNPKVLVGRLKENFKSALPNALKKTDIFIGKSYDVAFDIKNDRYYCSELVYELFREPETKEPLFRLEPMTFRIKGSDNFHPAWIAYFSNLKIPVPEGKPGINPGGISLSDRISIIKVFGNFNY